jgi:hypothetical protein
MDYNPMTWCPVCQERIPLEDEGLCCYQCYICGQEATEVHNGYYLCEDCLKSIQAEIASDPTVDWDGRWIDLEGGTE